MMSQTKSPSSGGPFLPSGVPSLDQVLGGGLVAGNTLLVCGPPGSGKTTLALQSTFSLAATGGTAIFVSTFSEPAPRLLEHARSFSFFDETCIGDQVIMGDVVPLLEGATHDLAAALADSVNASDAGLLVLDGLMTIRALQPRPQSVRDFLHQLGEALAPLGCSTILTTSEVPDLRGTTPAEFTMCDGLVELSQVDRGPGTARSLRVWKNRGAPCVLGEHRLTITGDGLAVFPRTETLPMPEPCVLPDDRLSSGSAELDAMMRGGLPRGSTTMVAGAPGTGKTLVALQYALAPEQPPALFVGFREPAARLVAKARAFGLDLEVAARRGQVIVERLDPTDLDVDIAASKIFAALDRGGATRLAIDSIAEIEHAAPPHRLRAFFSALTDGLRARGITTLLTRELSHVIGPELEFAGSPLAILAENLVLLRYVEYRGSLERILSILEMRDSDHDHSIRQYAIERDGIRVLSGLESAEGLLSGIARLPSEQRIKRSPSPSAEDAPE